MNYFDDAEEKDGVRFSWNVWPSSRLEGTRLVVPLACMYSPLKQTKNLTTVPYTPVYCRGPCGGVLNPYCQVDFRAKIWTCCFCLHRNNFPTSYADIHEQNLPAELIGHYSTIEYSLSNPQAPPLPRVYLFVVDICLVESEFNVFKESLIRNLALLPEDAVVGLITFGTTVNLYELGFEDMPKSYVFRGDRDVSPTVLRHLLGLASPAAGSAGGSGGSGSASGGAPAGSAGASSVSFLHAPPAQPRPNSFLKPLSECEFTLTGILEHLQRDPYPVKRDQRPLRATGVAMSVAVGLMESSYPGCAGRILLFSGGPCTQGPGQIVSRQLVDAIRSHADIQKENAPFVASATKHYSELATRVCAAGHVVDVFAVSVDQVGVMEMKDLVSRSGGHLVMSELFSDDMFQQSFRKSWARDPNDSNRFLSAYNGVFEIRVSKELKVHGIIGHCESLQKTGSSMISEVEIGVGNTTAWKICGLDPSRTLGVYFEIVNQHNTPIPPGQLGMVQFLTNYINGYGKRVLRVTTIGRGWADPGSGNHPLTVGFDQEAAASVIARQACWRADRENAFDVLRWIDKSLIKVCAKFADYRKDDPASFRLSSQFSLYPQFMFHFRRSNFLQTFGSSPDETTFYRQVLMGESVGNSVVMILPTLDAYSFNGPPTPVLLSSTSLLPDRILLLDTFFQVSVVHGQTIAQWKAEGYESRPEHENFRLLLQAPQTDAQNIIKDRFPHPKFISCDIGTSQSRYLYAAVDPAVPDGMQNAEVILSQDVSFSAFLDHLKKLAVSQQ